MPAWPGSCGPSSAGRFLRLASGDLLLLGRPWLLSWLGEGFHYRAMTHGQQLKPPQVLKYTTYVGEVVERYALELAEATFAAPVRVFGEQPYRSTDGDAYTSDVAVASGEDLVLFEVHSRRVAATAAVSGDAVGATTEVSRLLVGKAEQLGVCVHALLEGHATLPSVDIAGVRRIWPIVVPWATSRRPGPYGTSCGKRWTQKSRVPSKTRASSRCRS